MNHHSGAKSVTKAAASVAASATHSHEIDTAGFKYASIDVIFSPFTASNVSLASVLKVGEGDTSGGTMTDIAALVGGGSGGFSIAATGASTGAAVGGVTRFNIDLRGRKRYLTVSVSPSTTVAVVTSARLSKGEQYAVTATESGVNTVVNC